MGDEDDTLRRILDNLKSQILGHAEDMGLSAFVLPGYITETACLIAMRRAFDEGKKLRINKTVRPDVQYQPD